MNEQSVKQFRPKTSRGEDVITAIAEDDMAHFVDWGADIRAYIERLENALDIIERAISFYGLGMLDLRGPSGKTEQGTWAFAGVEGPSFIEAVENLPGTDLMAKVERYEKENPNA